MEFITKGYGVWLRVGKWSHSIASSKSKASKLIDPNEFVIVAVLPVTLERTRPEPAAIRPHRRPWTIIGVATAERMAASRMPGPIEPDELAAGLGLAAAGDRVERDGEEQDAAGRHEDHAR